MATSIYQRNFTERRKQQGLCLKCGNPLDREGIYCIECRKVINKSVKETRDWYKSNKICPRCRVNNLFGNENSCPECSAKMYADNIRSRERLGREHCNKVHAEWSRSTYAKRIELGVCTRCGKQKADYGFKTCGICRNKDKEYKQAKYGKPDRKERYKQGLCYFCDNPIKPGYRTCERHYQMNIEKARSRKSCEARKDLKESGILY